MRKLFSTILMLLSLIFYSQGTQKRIKNEVFALKKFHGVYNVDIVDYELINNIWVKQRAIKGFVLYAGDSIYLKRNQNNWLYRELNLIDHNSTLKGYIFNSKFGKTYINEDFKKITFFDAQDNTKKYVYNVGNLISNNIGFKSPDIIENKDNQTKPSFSQQSLSLDNSIIYKNYVIKPSWNNLTLLLFADMGSFRTMMNKYNYSLTTDGSAYIANTEIGSPYFTIGKSTDEINMIFTNEINLITIFRTELRQKLKGGNVSFERGFEIYRVQYDNEGFKYKIKIAIKQEPDGSGMVSLTLQ